MSLRKTRYVHLNMSGLCNLPFAGFTARLKPCKQKGFVKLSVALCSKHDQFCRAKGREVADKSPYYLVPISDVPRRLAEFRAKVFGRNWSSYHSNEVRISANAYAWIWKYFL